MSASDLGLPCSGCVATTLRTCKCGCLGGNASEITLTGQSLVVCYWQDDPPAMDFVTSAANLRMHIFSMNMKSRFDIKCELFVL